MNKLYLDKAELIALIGAEKVAELLAINCEPNARCALEDLGGRTEWEASICIPNDNRCDDHAYVYYMLDANDMDVIAEDGSNLDWHSKISHFEIR